MKLLPFYYQSLIGSKFHQYLLNSNRNSYTLAESEARTNISIEINLFICY